ncbi:MAG: TlyA family RNA methyltransferase [Thermogemmatispora sp.]|jgi:23S rRNA (cytidine1920-2'-O)/16S rRNA (cytidine1409-2'-O)-methyltransferase|uniref:TlyA family rRNA (Cytidine-2'-O)-methyltransferase n=1 Tax=Thermogemmatispora aurantia TaxID=2045279 RepID=A0A5J4KAP6_9CHLR|nr:MULTISPECIES: TlyA family RNA methyltransferase [Thermogemmatispora]MBE3565687.1 TlyA family RNA methyltransferase [Thermogemmatispora sp.]GER85608.1 TlyA family rRNA (cytidine-2'-O)-methyltransferase [Thermogemmatispora aurantia]
MVTKKKERLDVAMVRRGLVASRERAQALIMAGRVYVGERRLEKPGAQVSDDAEIRLDLAAPELRYVSRGGLKLEKALAVFGLDPRGLVALDVGASTGGFTDCLLQRGAARVYAVDVGHGQLAWKLRSDARVVVMEGVNIRYLETLPERPQCATVDVSFISLRLVLPPVARLLAPGAWVVALVKPQFEAGKEEADRGEGIIRDPRVHERVLRELSAWVPEYTPLQLRGVIESPIAGREGNKEFLMYLTLP